MGELSVVFPFSGLQKTGIIWIDYISQNKPVELKYVKYYFISFRNVINHKENLVSMIFHDLNQFFELEEWFIKALYSTNVVFETLCTINSNE